MAKKSKGFNPNKGFLAPLTGKKWRRESRAMTKIRYRPEESRLKQEIRASKRQKRSIRKMFKGYQGRLRESGQRQQAGYEQAGERIGQASQRATEHAEQLRQRLAQEGMADAQKRGVRYDPSGSQLSAEGQLARMASSNILAGVTAAQGASQGAFMRGKRDAARRSSIEQRMAAQARTANLRRERRELGREKGAYRASLRPAAREQERNYYLGLLDARRGKQALNLQKQQEARLAKGDKGGGGTRRKEDKGKVRKAVADLRQPGWRKQSPKSLRDYLIRQGYRPKVARRAVKRARG